MNNNDQKHSDADLVATLASLVSEGRNPETHDIDTLPALDIVAKINQQDKTVAEAIEKELAPISQAVDAITSAFQAGGRLVYLGAGTSGRLGILDASECPPTFGVEPSQVVALIAGGKAAMFEAQEGAEDSLSGGQKDLDDIGISDKDVVVGIAASGRTPYVIGGLNHANTIGCTTVAVSCNPGAPIAAIANIAISPVVGPEALTGSTRMKSGTAQKMVLNMLTTASMIKTGKCYKNLMVDLKATNEKLVARSTRIVMQACECNRDIAQDVLSRANGNTKLAIFMQLSGLDANTAQLQLERSSGHLNLALSDQEK